MAFYFTSNKNKDPPSKTLASLGNGNQISTRHHDDKRDEQQPNRTRSSIVPRVDHHEHPLGLDDQHRVEQVPTRWMRGTRPKQKFELEIGIAAALLAALHIIEGQLSLLKFVRRLYFGRVVGVSMCGGSPHLSSWIEIMLGIALHLVRGSD